VTVAEIAEALEPLARHALASYAIDVAGLELITNDWNYVFRVDLRDGDRRVLRVSLPDRRAREQVDAEMHWLDALARESDVRVPAPVAARDGSLVVEATADGVDGPRMCAVFHWIAGEPLIDHLTGPNLAAAGEAAAHLHEHARTFPIPPGLRTWDTPFPFEEPVVLFDREYEPILPPRERALMHRAREASEVAIARLQAAEPPRILHADLHDENFFVDCAAVGVLDFDDSMIGWPVQDLGITWFALEGRDGFDELTAAFREGYERVTPWPERESGEIATFAADRCLVLANYQVQDHDPKYLAQAPEDIKRYAKKIERFLGEGA
jgi:Ser/Thr protein kinase RdoA (MazF antagonist)